MNNVSIQATVSTPAVELAWDGGTVSLSGESYPENSYEFYRPIVEWLEAYLWEREAPLVLEVNLSYLNTSSIKCMMDILDLLDSAHRQGKAITVNWYYDADNDRALEMAEEFKEDIMLPFKVVGLAGSD